MKLLMLCREPRLYSCQRLKEAAESCGHQMNILDPNRCILKLYKNQPHFKTTKGGLKPTLRISPYDSLVLL